MGLILDILYVQVLAYSCAWCALLWVSNVLLFGLGSTFRACRSGAFGLVGVWLAENFGSINHIVLISADMAPKNSVRSLTKKINKVKLEIALIAKAKSKQMKPMPLPFAPPRRMLVPMPPLCAPPPHMMRPKPPPPHMMRPKPPPFSPPPQDVDDEDSEDSDFRAAKEEAYAWMEAYGSSIVLGVVPKAKPIWSGDKVVDGVDANTDDHQSLVDGDDAAADGQQGITKADDDQGDDVGECITKADDDQDDGFGEWF